MLLLVVALGLFGVIHHNSSVVEARNSGIIQAKYTGEQLFKGLFLIQGEVAERLTPSVFPKELYDEANREDVVEASDDLVAQVKAMAPNYFDELQRAVDSRNPVIIQRAINTGADLLIALSQQMQLNLDDVDPADPGSATGLCLFWAVGIVVVYYLGTVAQMAVAVTHVGAAAIYIYAAGVQYTAAAIDSSGSSNRLTNELFIKNIVTNL